MPTPPKLCETIPLPLFASVMGLCGLAMVWHAAEGRLELPHIASAGVTALAALVFIALLAAYACKWHRAPDKVKAELRHPVRINFLPAISINLILLGILGGHWLPLAGQILWMTGAVLHLLLTVTIVNIWFNAERPVASINPAWFIPAVGNVLVPVAAGPAGFPTIGWFFFTVGLFFWLILITLVFYRLITKPALEPPMRPTLVVMLAPPAVAFLAWLSLGGGLDGFGQALFFIAVFTFLLLLGQVPAFLRLPFFPSWWAYTFPVAAFTSASFRFDALSPLNIGALSWSMAMVATVIIVTVAIRTLIALARGEMAKH